MEAERYAKEEGQGQRSRLTVSHSNVAISLLSDRTSTSCLTRGIGLQRMNLTRLIRMEQVLQEAVCLTSGSDSTTSS